MKKHYLFFLFFFLTVDGWAQARIGFSLDSLRKEFSDFRYHTTVTNKDVLRMEILTTDYRAIYMFDKETEVCEVSIIYPYTKDIDQSMVKRFNDELITLSPTKWKLVSPEGIVLIVEHSRETKTGNICFIWTYLAEPEGETFFHQSESSNQ